MTTKSGLILGTLFVTACASGVGEPYPDEDAQNTPLVESVSQHLDTGVLFGTSGQQEFQDTWRDTITGAWADCTAWNAEMKTVGSEEFYHNLRGGKGQYETSGDQYRLERVDIHYGVSHGGGWTDPPQAAFTMWDKFSRALSPSMRLGDEGVGLSVMLNRACDQGKLDGNTFARWYPILSGGLRIAGASHGSFYFGSSEDNNFGKYVAQYLKDGQRITNAWGWGATKANASNEPIAIATGANSSDCASRRNMTLTTFKQKPRLVDNAIGYMCWNYWN
jgi:hypothetical protein